MRVEQQTVALFERVEPGQSRRKLRFVGQAAGGQQVVEAALAKPVGAGRHVGGLLQLVAAQEAAYTAQATLAEAQKRTDGLTALLEQAQAKAESAIAEAAKLAGKLEALEAAPKNTTTS